MPKLRKQRRLKKYSYDVNRKRLRNRLTSQGNIECTQIKAAWDNRKSTKFNLANMGLAYDSNNSIKAPTNSNWIEKVIDTNGFEPSKVSVVGELEQEAKAPRKRLLRLPNSQVQWLTYLLDKYGDDYRAMVKDKKNYYQETWKQIRNKIKVFKGIPEQYSKYLEDRGLKDPSKKETSSDSNDES